MGYDYMDDDGGGGGGVMVMSITLVRIARAKSAQKGSFSFGRF